MAIKITWNEFLDLSDKSSVQEIHAELTRIETTFTETVTSIVGQNTKLKKAVSALSEEAQEMVNSLNAMNAATEENQKSIAGAAKKAEDMAKSEAKLNKEIEENEKAVTDLTAAIDGATKAKEKLEKQNKAEEGSLTSLKQELREAIKAYENMGTSVTQAVKDEQINKIKTLTNAVAQGDKVVKEARKAIDFAAGSYQHLSQEVANAKKRLKEMEGGVKSNSKEVQDLKKFVSEGTDQLKAFDKELGDNGREVGNYGIAVEGLDQSFGGLIGNLKQTGKQFLALASNPFVAVAAGLIAIFMGLKSSVMAFFETTGEGEDIAERQAAVWSALAITLKKSWGEFGKSVMDVFGGEGALTGVIAAFLNYFAPSLTVAFLTVADQATDLANKLDDLGERIISNIITRSQRELAVNELLEKSKNKLLYTDQERLDFLKEIRDVQAASSKEEIEIEKEKLKSLQKKLIIEGALATFMKDEVKFTAEGLELIKKQIKESNLLEAQKTELAEQIAKIIDLEAQYFQQQKKNTGAITALTLEIEKAERERIARKLLANQELNKILINENIKTNNETLKDDNLTFMEYKTALESNLQQRYALLQIEKDQAITTARTTAEERIRAEGKRVEDHIGLDEALKAELIKIQEKYNFDTSALMDQLLNDIDIGYLKKLEQAFKKTYQAISISTNYQLEELNKNLLANGGSLEEYEAMKAQIIRKGQVDAINEQLDFLELQYNAYEDDSVKQMELAQKIAEFKKQLSEIETMEYVNERKKREAAEKAFNAKLREFAAATSQEVLNLLDAGFSARIEKNIAYFNEQLATEEEAKNRSLAIAGNDAQARALIEQDFANKKKAIDKQIAQEKRKQAIFQKSLDATSIVISTAKGIASAVAESPLTFGLPWSAFVGVIGALQLATVLARPIPQFFKGTESSPAGPAWVAERGPELAVNPKGELTYYTKPQIVNLEKGTKIKTATETSQLMKDALKYGDGFMYDQLGLSYKDSSENLGSPSFVMDLGPIKGAINESTAQITTAIKNQPQDVWDDKGYRQYTRSENGRVLRLGSKYKF